MAKTTAVLIGAGGRGTYTFGTYAKNNPEKLKIVAVAEPDIERRTHFSREHGIPANLQFEDWTELFIRGKIADGAIIATGDDMHLSPSIRAMETGYDILLEKPMARTLDGAVEIARTSSHLGKKVMVCHVLRYTAFYRKIRELMHSGIIGEIVGIEAKEDIGYFHMAHSFVRGNWRNSTNTAPIMLTKSCHDLDLLYWLIGKKCEKLASFGELTHFKAEKKPNGSPLRCIDGCPVEKICPYSAMKIYLGNDRFGLPIHALTADTSYEGRLKALKEGPYGRCVYACDNDVADHQVTIMQFGDIEVSFTLQAFTADIRRKIRIFGTGGEINGLLERDDIVVERFGEEPVKVAVNNESNFGHNGGDYYLMNSFVEMLSDGAEKPLTSACDSLESHIMAFAAEEARLEKRVIDMPTYRAGFLTDIQDTNMK